MKGADVDDLKRRAAEAFETLNKGGQVRAEGMALDCLDPGFGLNAMRHLAEDGELGEMEAERTVDDFLRATADEMDDMVDDMYGNDGYTYDGYDPDGNYDPDHDEVERLERLGSYITD